MTLLVSHTWTPWHLELGRRQTQPPTLFLVVGMAQRCGTCRSEHLSPLTCPPARPHLWRPSEGLPGCLGPTGARPPPAPWKGTPAPLWEENLLFISHPRQRAHDAPSLACMLLLTTLGLQDLPALREGSVGFLFAFHAHLLLPSQPWRLFCPVFRPEVQRLPQRALALPLQGALGGACERMGRALDVGLLLAHRPVSSHGGSLPSSFEATIL